VAHEQGIDVVVRPVPGRHNWQFAGQAFADALPWLMARIDAPN
jgi:S-formylglutathione hydrolase FrmB